MSRLTDEAFNKWFDENIQELMKLLESDNFSGSTESFREPMRIAWNEGLNRARDWS